MPPTLSCYLLYHPPSMLPVSRVGPAARMLASFDPIRMNAMSHPKKLRTLFAGRARFPVFLLALTLLSLAGCETAPEPLDPTLVLKGPNDERDYRHLKLVNELPVLLVSHPESEKAAAAMTVHRGSYHEPEAHPGLAQVFARVPFIGTEKYPEEEGFSGYLTAHGGSGNAETAGDHTSYFFDVDASHFGEALDRFGQFFIAPLLDPQSVEKAAKAFRSDYQLQSGDDQQRLAAVNKAVMNPQHPASRSGMGSVDALSGDELVGALRGFFESSYSADQMGLVVYGNESLDVLEATTRSIFEDIINRGLGPAEVTEAPYAEGALPATVYMKPRSEMRSVIYRFPIPATQPHYRSKPMRYITNLLAHQGPGGLYSSLYAAGWIESLIVTVQPLDDAHDVLEVSIELTEDGVGQIDSVSTAVLAFLDYLKSQPPSEWRYQEQAQMGSLNFRYLEHDTAKNFVSSMAPFLGELPAPDLLRAPYLFTEFDPELIGAYLDQLRADKVLMQLVSQDVNTDRADPWFEARYGLQPGPIAVDNVRFAFALPQPNRFLPDEAVLSELVEDDGQPPYRVSAIDNAEVWLDTDLEFGMPRANLYLLLQTPAGFDGRREQVVAINYLELVKEALNDSLYPARLAGMHYSLEAAPAGYLISIGGYSDKQQLLLSEVLEGLMNAPVDRSRFVRQNARLVRYWRNQASEPPITQTHDALSQSLQSSIWPPGELARTCARLTEGDVVDWRTQRLARVGLTALMTGNLDTEDAQEIIAQVAEQAPLASVERFQPTVIVLRDSFLLPLSINHQDAALVLYLQNQEVGIKAHARSRLADRLVSQPFSTELGAKQQLGGDDQVFSGHLLHQDRGGLAFAVQSPTESTMVLENAVMAFLGDRALALERLPQSEFDALKAGLIAELTSRDKNLAARSSRMWGDLALGFTEFDQNQQLAEAIESLTKANMRAFFRGLAELAWDRRLVIYSTGRFDDEVPIRGDLLESPTDFKR